MITSKSVDKQAKITATGWRLDSPLHDGIALSCKDFLILVIA